MCALVRPAKRSLTVVQHALPPTQRAQPVNIMTAQTHAYHVPRIVPRATIQATALLVKHHSLLTHPRRASVAATRLLPFQEVSV